MCFWKLDKHYFLKPLIMKLFSNHIFIFQLLVAATMAVYKDAVTNFLPTPSKSHYVFNLRDFARVIRGVLLVPHEKMSEIDKLHRLWVHEVYRVFYDRLIDKQDRYMYQCMIKPTCSLYSSIHVPILCSFI